MRDAHPASVVLARQPELSLAVVSRTDVEEIERELRVEPRALDMFERAQVGIRGRFAFGAEMMRGE